MTNFTNSDDELVMFKAHDIRQLLPQLGWHPVDGSDRKPAKKFAKGSEEFSVFEGKMGNKGNPCWRGKNFQTGESRTIVDFVLPEVGGNMGQARKLLRELIGSPAPTSTSSPAIPSSTSPKPAPVKTYKTSSEVRSEYTSRATQWHSGDRLPDFLRDRGIQDLGEQFSKSFVVDHGKWQNVRFPYFEFDGNTLSLCAAEEKNHNFQCYTTDGKAGIWVAYGDACAPWVVCESPIDAMSFDAMATCALRNSRAGLRLNYVVLRSGAEDMLVDFLKFEHKVRCFSELIVATDNDAAGALYANKVMSGLMKLEGLKMRMSMPNIAFTDWNEALMKKRSTEATGPSDPTLTPSQKPAREMEPMH